MVESRSKEALAKVRRLAKTVSCQRESKQVKDRVGRLIKILNKKVSLILFDGLCSLQYRSKVKIRTTRQELVLQDVPRLRQPEVTSTSAARPSFGWQPSRPSSVFLEQINREIDQFAVQLQLKDKWGWNESSLLREKTPGGRRSQLSQKLVHRPGQFRMEERQYQPPSRFEGISIIPIVSSHGRARVESQLRDDETPIKKIKASEPEVRGDSAQRKVQQINEIIKRIQSRGSRKDEYQVASRETRSSREDWLRAEPALGQRFEEYKRRREVLGSVRNRTSKPEQDRLYPYFRRRVENEEVYSPRFKRGLN